MQATNPRVRKLTGWPAGSVAVARNPQAGSCQPGGAAGNWLIGTVSATNIANGAGESLGSTRPSGLSSVSAPELSMSGWSRPSAEAVTVYGPGPQAARSAETVAVVVAETVTIAVAVEVSNAGWVPSSGVAVSD